MHVNIQSVRNKQNEIEAFLAAENLHLTALSLSEHWLTSDEVEAFNLHGYTVASYYTRPSVSGGGVINLIEYKNSFIILDKINKLSVEQHCEITAVELENYNLIIVTVYRSPAGNFEIFIDVINQVLSKLNLTKNIVINGDFNVRFCSKNNHSATLCDLLLTYGLVQTIFENTRKKNCIDNIFTNVDPNLFKAYNINANLSDHDQAQIIELQIGSHKKIARIKTKLRPITRIGLFKMYNTLENVNWEFTKTDNDPDKLFNKFLTILRETFEQSFPEVECYVPQNQNQPNVEWFTSELKTMREWLNFLLDTYKNNPTPALKAVISNFKINYKNEIKIAKQSANDLYVIQSTNPVKAMWNLVNAISKKDREVIKSTLLPDDYNNYFVNIAKTIIPHDLASTTATDYLHNIKIDCNDHLNLKEVSLNEMRDIIDSLRKSKSKDIYNFNVHIIKTLKNILISPLTDLVNLSFRHGKFPDALKLAKVVPIYKNGDQNDPTNYRPISLLPVISKIYETAIKTRISDFFECNHLFTPNQFGFRKKKSTTSALTKFVNDTLNCFESGQYSVSLFCDLSKAFDCVQHDILIAKLKHYKLDVRFITLIKSYLENRRQVVYVDGTPSEIKTISHGVPQGSVLGPILFLIYANDLPANLPNTDVTLFADDTTITVKGTNLDDALRLSECAQSVANDWFKANFLKLNADKTNTVIFSLRDINCINPERTKFLGIYVDPTLNWSPHVVSVSHKISKLTYLLRFLRNCMSTKIMLTVYFAHIQSQLTYGILLWGHTSSCQRLFGMQRKIVRIIAGAKYRENCVKFFQQLKILTIPCLYILECLLYVKRHLQEFSTHREVHPHDTRFANNIYKPYLRLNKSQNGPRFIAPVLFNSLPTTIKELNIKKFKRTIKKFLIQNCFYSVNEFLAQSYKIGI